MAAGEDFAGQNADLDEREANLAGQQRELMAAQNEISKAARELEVAIQKLAKQEAEVQQNKKELRKQAKDIGRRRSQLIKRSKGLTRELTDLATARADLNQRQNAAAQQAQELAALQAQQQAALQAQQKAIEEAKLAAQAEESRPDGPEQRTRPRVPVAVDVSFNTEHNFYMGLTENLSEGGLFVATYDNIPIGTELALTLNLPDYEAIQATGIVRWVREYSTFTAELAPGVGVELLGLGTSDQEAIRSFLALRDPIFYDQI